MSRHREPGRAQWVCATWWGFALVLSLSSGASASPQEEKSNKPFRLQDAIEGPEWLRVSGSLRLRWEGIDGQFRSTPRLSHTDHLGFQRTILKTEADFETVAVAAEVMDSRHYGGSNNSTLNTSNVNTLDFLQAYAEVRLGESGEGQHRLRFGRHTIDLGSRRLVARNRYRNTINSFTGASWLWDSEDSSFQAFWTLPVRRRPGDLPSVVDNEVELDNEDVDLQFFGAFYEREMCHDQKLEVYVYGLFEDERSRERMLLTPGFRIRRPAKRARYDYEYEAAYQFGDIKPNGMGSRLDHRAWFQHASVGYTFDCDWTPRVRAAVDYASGDRNPNDGDNGRFDTLFGARRFEYGPTGIYGAIARTNLLSPDLRVMFKPCSEVQVMVAWRGFWLASRKDAWPAARVADPTGGSGRHVGQQVESRVRWDLIKDSVRLEFGAAYLFDGRFQRDATGGQDTDTAYGYCQVAWRF